MKSKRRCWSQPHKVTFSPTWLSRSSLQLWVRWVRDVIPELILKKLRLRKQHEVMYIIHTWSIHMNNTLKLFCRFTTWTQNWNFLFGKIKIRPMKVDFMVLVSAARIKFCSRTKKVQHSSLTKFPRQKVPIWNCRLKKSTIFSTGCRACVAYVTRVHACHWLTDLAMSAKSIADWSVIMPPRYLSCLSHRPGLVRD